MPWSLRTVIIVSSIYVGEVEKRDFCLEESPKPHRKQQASSSFSTSISSITMSNQPKDSSLSSPESEVFELLRSPKPRSMNDSTGAARSSAALPIRTTPSSTIRAADAGMAIAGEIPDNLFTHQVNIDPHLIRHCRRPCWTPTAFPCLDWSVPLKILLLKLLMALI